MAKLIEIRLIDNPSDNDHVYYFPVVPSQFYSNYTAITFKNTVVIATVLIGATKNDTITNMVSFLNSIYSSYSWITVTQVTDGVNIYMDANDVTFTTIPSPIVGDITFTVIDIPTEEFTRDNVILSRSPYNITIVPTSLFDEAFLNLKVYRGTQTTNAPLTDTFTLSKSVIQAGQPKIRFEVSKLINDYVKSNIYDFGSIDVHTSNSYESVWVDAEITAYYLGDIIGSVNRQYLTIDGFGWHTELSNPKLTKNVFTSNTEHIVYRGSDYPVYFFTKDLVSITIDGVSVPFTLDATINNQVIAFVNIGAYINTQNSFTAVFEYDTVTETHTFIVKDECRFPLYNCFFKNKYGFWQSIPFNLRSKHTINIESNKYSPVVSVFGDYSLQSHNTKTYIPTAKEVITCNTDYLPEYYNDLFDEMLLSEFVYLEHNGQYLPVNVNKNSLDKKTKVFDKLIQYTMDFEYSFNKMNAVI